MRPTRLTYFLLCLLTIALGLLSRKAGAIPAFTGDVLYAVMMYWIFRLLLFKRPKISAMLFAVLICFLIEFLQLINTPFFIGLRSHPFLRMIFGQGFLWSDLLAYCAGALLARALDRKV